VTIVDQKRFDRDELARRRALRAERGAGEDPAQDGDEEVTRLSWGETFAMIIAAYQVLLPVMLVVLGVMGALFLFFRYVF
jgi:hypothetical protein